MKVLPFKIPAIKHQSIKVERDVLERFYPHFHTHEELQLIWIIQGEGTAFVGDRILPFNNDALFLLSPNLPHVFKSDENDKKVESLSIYFPKTIFERNKALYEFEPINRFLANFKRGLLINQTEIASKMLAIEAARGLKRILLLIELIESISLSKSTEPIASATYSTPKTKDSEKISGIIEHLYTHYSQHITLDEVAEKANLTPQAFCRYFKRHTKQSMVQYLNQIRIGKVCGWLQEKKYTVTESCYQAGFNNISNFNRQFKAITGYTPSGYMAKQKTIE